MSKEEKILVVDDDITLLKMAEELLHNDYSVSIAKSGEDALKLLRKGYLPDLILLDIDMPEMDGFTVFHNIRAMESCKMIPIIYLTGITKPNVEVKGLKLGAVDYITKPFVKEVLLARLQIHLEQSKQQKKLRMMMENREGLEFNIDKLSLVKMQLTETEFAISKLAALGYTNEEIGQELGYSYNYVKKLISYVFDKFQISKRSELRQLFF